jgi:predicted metal-dependent hydrolase
MRPTPAPDYLAAYPAALAAQVRQLIAHGQLGGLLLQHYPTAHTVRTDRALYDYVCGLKDKHMRNAAPLSKVVFDGNLQLLRQALGMHTSISRVQGTKLKAKREIRVANVFKAMPEAFLRMIVVHELAHLRERGHGKAFYQLCLNMEADYHQFEFDLRCYLSYLDAGGEPLWGVNGDAAGVAESALPLV